MKRLTTETPGHLLIYDTYLVFYRMIWVMCRSFRELQSHTVPAFQVWLRHFPSVCPGCAPSVGFLVLRFLIQPAWLVPITCPWTFEVVTLALGPLRAMPRLGLLPVLCHVRRLGESHSRCPGPQLLSKCENDA